MLSVVIGEQIFVDTTLSTLIDKIEQLDNAVQNSQNINATQIQIMVDELNKFWTDKENILCLSINHNDLNKVGEQIKKVKVYIEQDNKEDCVYEIDVLRFYAEGYKHIMELTIQNIF